MKEGRFIEYNVKDRKMIENDFNNSFNIVNLILVCNKY